MVRLQHIDQQELIDRLKNFSILNDINPLSLDELTQLIYFIKKEKPFVYIEALDNALDAWSKGLYDSIRRPRRLNSRFICSLIEIHMDSSRKLNQTNQAEEKEVTPQDRDSIMQNGYETKLQEYKDGTLVSILWLGNLYNWMEEKNLISVNDFSEQTIQEKYDNIKARHQALRKSKKSWASVFTEKTHDNIFKSAIVALQFDKLIKL